MTKNIIRIRQVSSVEDILSMSPINAETTHNVVLVPIGEGAVDALLTPNWEGLGHGWDTLAHDLDVAREDSLAIIPDAWL